MKNTVRQKIDNFFSKYPLYSYDKGSTLIQAGSDPSGIFHIVKGQVRQYDITESGSEVVVNVFKTPAFFPMNWAINKTPNKYFYEASFSVKVRQAPVEDVLEFLVSNNDVTYDLLKRLYSGADGMQRRMAHLMGGNSESRLLFELIIECERFGDSVSEGTYTLELTEDEVASRAGLSRETVSRMIKKLKQQGYVAVKHGTIVVTNLPDLQARLGSDL